MCARCIHTVWKLLNSLSFSFAPRSGGCNLLIGLPNIPPLLFFVGWDERERLKMTHREKRLTVGREKVRWHGHFCFYYYYFNFFLLLLWNLYIKNSRWIIRQVITVNGARVVKPDIQATNGVIHIVDRVLFPVPQADIYNTLKTDPQQRYTTLISAIDRAGLTAVLANPTGKFSFFLFYLTTNILLRKANEIKSPWWERESV